LPRRWRFANGGVPPFTKEWRFFADFWLRFGPHSRMIAAFFASRNIARANPIKGPP
jgi:hypothetical protein